MHRMTRKIAHALVLTLTVVGLSSTALADHHKKDEYKKGEHKHDIVDTAVKAGSFNTLVAAVKAAGLAETLKGDGPFTVFAPTDDAFAKLPDGTIEYLLKPENKDKLVSILTYHVVPAKVKAKQAVKLTAAPTVNGQRLDIKADKHGVMIDGAKVTATDIMASNGVIHVIDTVVMPSGDDILTTAGKAGSFKTLAAAIKAAGLVETLQGDGPFTVFAPTDEAFAKLPAGTIDTLLKPENKDKLIAILTYHVVPGRVFSDAAIKQGKARTVQGNKVMIKAKDGNVHVNNATVISADIDATNGTIHVIDTVLIPEDKASAKADASADDAG